MPYAKNYDPNQLKVIFNGAQISGFADDMVSVSRMTDGFSEDVGAQGDVVRVRSRDRRGTIEITLQQASPSNDVLSTFAATDESAGTAYGAVMVSDLNGTSLYRGATAWIKKVADSDWATAHKTRKWTITVAQLELIVGGSSV